MHMFVALYLSWNVVVARRKLGLYQPSKCAPLQSCTHTQHGQMADDSEPVWWLALQATHHLCHCHILDGETLRQYFLLHFIMFLTRKL